MNLQKNKTVYAIVLVIVMTIPAFAASIQFVEAQTQWNTYFHVMIAPNPVGVGQTVLVTLQIDRTNPQATVVANNWQGLTCKITKPDGTTETKGPYQAYSIANVWFSYTPTMEGTYIFEGSWPGQWVNSTTYQRWYKPSSTSTTLVVQRDPILPISNNPLPTGYWTRPIYAENKEWYKLADNWLMPSYDSTDEPVRRYSVFAPYTSAPDSAHVMWTKPLAFGGVVGGKFGDETFYTGSAYELHYSPLILSGRIIYREHDATSLTYTGTRCISLYTGEEIWYLNNTSIAFAQTLNMQNPNEHGVLPYLWSISGTNWLMYDAFEGRMRLNLTNMPSGGKVTFGPSGEILIYILSGSANTLTLWNTTRAIMGVSSTYVPHQSDTWSPSGTINASRPASGNSSAPYSPINNSPFMGVEWNVTVPDVPGTQSLSILGEGYILAAFTDSSLYPPTYQEMAYNVALEKDYTGNYPASLAHLWIANRTTMYGEYRYNVRTPLNSIGGGVYVAMDAGPLKFYGYDIKTGRLLWVTDPLPSGWAYFTYIFPIAYGKFYTTGYDGHVRAWSTENGKLVWDYYVGNSGLENAYGTYPIFNGLLIADKKVFVSSDEHSADSIPWRGGKIWCIDAETGQGLWNISGWYKIPAISDGIATAINNLDMQIYTFGKGPSATTIAAPQSVVPKGTAVMITGSVTDQSPAQKGTPAISDKDMSAWMEYLHMQKPRPADAVGVQVKLTAIDPNGNTQDIGTVTSDSNGNFGVMWTPPVEGTYKLIATFEDTSSYGGSDATTYLGVGPAAAVPQPTSTAEPTVAPTTVAPTPASTVSPSVVPEPEAAPSTDIYIIAAAAVIIVVVAVAAVFLRKRK